MFYGITYDTRSIPNMIHCSFFQIWGKVQFVRKKSKLYYYTVFTCYLT